MQIQQLQEVNEQFAKKIDDLEFKNQQLNIAVGEKAD